MQYRRQSMRLAGYDYTQTGYYFVTICVKDREHLFGRINNKKMILNLFGRVVQSKWIDITTHVKNAQLDVFQIMPNHLHGIIILNDKTVDDMVGAKHSRQNFGIFISDHAGNASPLHIISQPNGTKRGSISAIIQNFSSITTRKINQIRKTPGSKLWQRNYYEHIIRNQTELDAIRQYIINNPSNWIKRK